jgi:hypothetical protein
MILLGFDIEEFDLPFEHNQIIDFPEQLNVSTKGTQAILAILRAARVKATFFCTANYSVNKPDVIKQIVDEGHEIASHGYYHSDFDIKHLLSSKLKLEQLSGGKVTGYRMPRMMPVDEAEINKAGYLYNSSINPTWIPGRYNNLKKPRTWFFDHDVLQIPASVSPLVRFPLFWLSFHNLPMGMVKWMAAAAHRKDGYLNLYFHPWEFVDISAKDLYGLPSHITRNSGKPFVKRMEDFISWAKAKGYTFERTGDFAGNIIKNR